MRSHFAGISLGAGGLPCQNTSTPNVTAVTMRRHCLGVAKVAMPDRMTDWIAAFDALSRSPKSVWKPLNIPPAL